MVTLVGMTTAFRAKDGAELTLEPRLDGDGPYLEVLTPGGGSLGTVRLLGNGKSVCRMTVATADRYFAEIVAALMDHGIDAP
jgi:hypothetical protein